MGDVVYALPGDAFPRFVADWRRLARRPYRFRWRDDATVLVRVDSPPLLVVERYSHLATDDPGPFTEPIDCLDLPSLPPATQDAPPGRVGVRPRLVASVDDDPPRLWVIRDDALAKLAAYCRTAHQAVLGRFRVAVSASAGVPCVVLRAATAKGPPPVFVGEAHAHRPLPGLPDVFVPLGMRLSPTLRRDALRRALGVPSDRVAWLHPLGDGAFRRESLPESAFRPLADAVDYKPPIAPRSLQSWESGTSFALPGFVERVEAAPLPPPAPVVVVERPPSPPKAAPRAGLWKRIRHAFGRRRSRPAETTPTIDVAEVMRVALNQGSRLHLARPETAHNADERCLALEVKFLRAPPADANDESWAELAAAYDAAGNHADAALCWLNSLWGRESPSPLWAWGWLRAEAKAARPEVKAIDPSPWLDRPPGPGTTRALAAWVVWASVQESPPAVLTTRAADLQARLEAHEDWLPVRSAWLAMRALTRRGDALALARSRDRLTRRLRDHGLSEELDTPSFLRFSGDGRRERYLEARRWLVDKRDLVHQWLARVPGGDPTAGDGTLRRVGLQADVAHTRAYADLLLSWGLTRFAEYTTGESFRRLATLPDAAVHRELREAFDFRIAQAREGKPHRGPLPPDLVRRIALLPDLERYAVDKLRENSRVLEPTARIDGYRETVYRKSSLAQTPAFALYAATERLDETAARLLAAEAALPGRPHLVTTTSAALDRAAELDEEGAAAVLAVLPAALDAAGSSTRTLGRMIERSFVAADAWDRADLARDLTGRLLRLVDGRAGWEAAELAAAPASRTLRRLGLAMEADRVLHAIALGVTQDQPFARVRQQRGADWPAALRALLHVAAGWYYAGRDEDAHAVLDEARHDLFTPDLSPAVRTPLALAYAATLSHAPARVALGRLEEMFQRLEGVAADGSTNAWYALRPLMIVETAVRAVVSDDVVAGPHARAWRDADELSVRRRIRDELKSTLSAQGW